MIDLSEFPSPENAPEPGTCVRLERPEPGLAVVTLDPPHRSFAVLDAPLLRDLEAVWTELEKDSSLMGVVLTGRSPSQFAAGADVDAIGAITDPAIVERTVLVVHELFRRISKLPAKTVAAVGGPVPGGALEISLACDLIVATDAKNTRIGLPETQLGIIPAWGGTHRLPKRIGVPAALDAILTGRLYPARKAQSLGIVDRLTKPEYLLRVASDIAMGRLRCERKKRGSKTWLVDKNFAAKKLIARQAEKQVMAKTHGHYPAPLKALELVLDAPGTSMEEAAGKEARVAGELATGPICKSLISIFQGSEEAKKLARGKDGFEPRKFERAAVIGAGVMGGGIASVMADKGTHVRLVDLSQDALDQALAEHQADVEKKRKRRRLKHHEANAAIDRLDTSVEMHGFGRVQIVVEAIAEVLEVKRKVFAQVAEKTSDDAILATNTSSLSVDAIAAGLPHPERVVGLHFFNPVKKMPLVEIVKGAKTADTVVTEVAALAIRLGKTPVVTKDVAGFLVNRILGPYLDEAVRLFVAGVNPERVDRLMVEFGMPMGPFTLLDEVGLDIAAHAAKSLHEAYGERMTPSEGIEGMLAPERLGKKTGLGFYRHVKGKKGKPKLADDLARYQKDGFARSLSDEQIIDRLVLSMVNEGARCLAEEVVAGPRELDLATVFGTGFAPFRGGLLRYADSVGAAELVKRLERIASSQEVSSRPGGTAKFTPADILKKLAAENRGFHGQVAPAASPAAQEPVGAS